MFSYVCQDASIDIEHMSIHGIRGVRSEEHGRTTQLLGVEPTTCGCLGTDERVERMAASIGLTLTKRSCLRGGYDIQDGKILYDNIPITQICRADLRRSLGMVLQETHLFTGTVMENIRYGRLDATDQECIDAAKLVHAHDFISRLAQGYNTMLNADGGNLSQGERQLIAIARAAVANPPALILDEATSNIDTRTERMIQQGMDSLMKNRSTFVIAHRLSTVRNADIIVVMERGRIIEQGTHDELIAEKGRYYQLYTGNGITD